MFSRPFIERLILLLVGAYTTYYVGLIMMEKTMMLELGSKGSPEIKKKLEQLLKKELILNSHEESLLSMVVFPENIDIDMEDICGHFETKELIKNMVLKPLGKDYVKRHELLEPPNGIILYGPPGTGKTMLAKAIAKQLQGIFINFEISSIENKMYGESGKLIKALFTLAEKLKPCVIFMDELDGIAASRNPFDQSFVTGIKTFMFAQLDGIIKRDSNILFIGATNKLGDIDSAMKRRLRLHIPIILPDSKARKDIFSKQLKEPIMIDSEGMELLVKDTENFSGSDLYEICKLCAHLSVQKDVFPNITKEIAEKAINTFET
tara:strand:+ start:725 stop:1687 length:963 start_codon:yes stop_codon:yes gene_type:complete